jgi:hypothetical protein
MYFCLSESDSRAGGMGLAAREQLQVVVSLYLGTPTIGWKTPLRQEGNSTLIANDGEFVTYPFPGSCFIITSSCVSTTTPTTLLSPTQSTPIVQPSPDSPLRVVKQQVSTARPITLEYPLLYQWLRPNQQQLHYLYLLL